MKPCAYRLHSQQLLARQLDADLHRAVREARHFAEEAGNLFGFVGVEVDPSRHFGNLEEVELGVAAGTVNITLTQGYIIKTTDRDILGRLDNLDNEQLRFFVFRNNRPAVVSPSEAQSLVAQGSQRVWVADLNQDLPGNEAEANRQRFGYLKNNLSFEEFVFLTTYAVPGHNPQSEFFRFTDNVGREIVTDWQLLHSGRLAFFDRVTGNRVSNPIRDLDYAIFFTPAGSDPSVNTLEGALQRSDWHEVVFTSHKNNIREAYLHRAEQIEANRLLGYRGLTFAALVDTTTGQPILHFLTREALQACEYS